MFIIISIDFLHSDHPQLTTGPFQVPSIRPRAAGAAVRRTHGGLWPADGSTDPSDPSARPGPGGYLGTGWDDGRVPDWLSDWKNLYKRLFSWRWHQWCERKWMIMNRSSLCLMGYCSNSHISNPLQFVYSIVQWWMYSKSCDRSGPWWWCVTDCNTSGSCLTHWTTVIPSVVHSVALVVICGKIQQVITGIYRDIPSGKLT